MKTIRKVLVANRGEIAVRIIRSLQKLNIVSVAIYAQDDTNSLHSKIADEKVLIPGNTLEETYLNIHEIISIAVQTGVDAIHPGYGFLSENESFAKACQKENLIFIGPSPESISLMGNKVEARKFVKHVGIPIIEGMTVNKDEIHELKDNLSYPVILKAAAGGGGKGMRIIRDSSNLIEEWNASRREVLSYFGNGEIYLEKYIENPRHIEVQVLSDHHGNHVHLFERECSLQRRYQKIIEEAPATSIQEDTRKNLHEAALSIVRSMNYQNAGTIEFLVDKDENIYFLEMNTRIQVEHPITEMITGIDIVNAQIQIARGEKIPFSQKEIQVNGHAIEARLYAEDPENNFTPSPGEILLFHIPEDVHIRIDKWFDGSYNISANYDPLLAKIISHGTDRTNAIDKLKNTFLRTAIHGVKNNASYIQQLLSNRKFTANQISTQYLENNHHFVLDELKQKRMKTEVTAGLIATMLYEHSENTTKDPWLSNGNWRIFNQVSFQVNGQKHILKIRRITNQSITVHPDKTYNYQIKDNCIVLQETFGSIEVFVSRVNQKSFFVTYSGHTFNIAKLNVLEETKDENNYLRNDSTINYSNGQVISPLNGKVVKVQVENGQKVLKGDVLVIVESMKMENKIICSKDGVVHEMNIKQGQQVRGNEVLMYIKQEIESIN
jgi:3-methylcrotonyl-CoA carboxylase alpha subunit